jgi:hypothetical protein
MELVARVKRKVVRRVGIALTVTNRTAGTLEADTIIYAW